MKYLSLLPMLLFTALLWGQDIDQKRMNRDIEVAENILDALLEENKGHLFRSSQVEGTYLEGYGVLFTIKSPFGGLAFGPAVVWGGNPDRLRSTGGINIEIPGHGQNEVYAISADSLKAASIMSMETFKTVSETFLADYGYLLTQLPAREKICIKYSTSRNMDFPIAAFDLDGKPEKLSMPGYTAVTSRQAVEDFRAGKIDRKGLAGRIEYSEAEAVNSETDRELILLNSIFNRLYQGDLSEGFRMRGQGRLEKIAGLGALFSYSFSTRRDGFFYKDGAFGIMLDSYNFSFSDDEAEKAAGRARLRTAESLEKEKKDEDMEDEPEPDFDEFLETFKSSVIEYGSTVRSLKPEEILSFELQLPSCDDCDDRPEKVKIVAKQSLLEQYRQGKLNLEAAKDQLQVTRF